MRVIRELVHGPLGRRVEVRVDGGGIEPGILLLASDYRASAVLRAMADEAPGGMVNQKQEQPYKELLHIAKTFERGN